MPKKSKLMGNAAATLFPITWREPFGLVMVESMVTGTPVVAMNLGSTKEVIVDGKTGFLCDSVEECVAAIEPATQLDRYTCRQHVIDKFSVQEMTSGYEAVYQKILAQRFIRNGYSRPVKRIQFA